MKRCPTLVTEECNLKHCLIFIFTGLAKIKTLTISNVGEMWSNGNFTHCRWVGKMIQSRWFYPYIPYDPLIPFLGYMLQGILACMPQDTYTESPSSAPKCQSPQQLIIIKKKKKYSKCSFAVEKYIEIYSYIAEYYTAVNMHELEAHATIQRNFKTNFEQIKQVLKEYLIPIYKLQKHAKLTHMQQFK